MQSGLHEAPGNSKHFCGVTAISAVTGMLAPRVEDFVLSHRINNPPPKRGSRCEGARVTTMWGDEIVPVLNAIGVTCVMTFCPTYKRDCPTFAQWLRTRDKRAVYIVLITGHFVAVCGDQLVDTRYRTPTSIRALRRFKRTRVFRVFHVNPQA